MILESPYPLHLRKGSKLRKGDVRSELFKVKIHGKKNAVRFFSLLQEAGYIEIRGKVIIVKKDFLMN